MMYITAVAPLTGKRSKKVRIRFDDGTSVILYKREATRYELEPESEISEEVWERLLREVFIPRARSRAMHLLEKQDRTRANLISKLREGGYPDIAIEEAVSYVEGYHYIDDDRYAASFVRYHQSGKSRRRIMMDLKQKGVSEDIIKRAIELEFTASEEDMIREAVKKKGYDPDNSDIRERQRIYRFLTGRGFSYEDIDRALSSLARESD